ncbi:MAG: hypothetical protein FWF31_05090 [Desulfobulbus sp.]|nr:hypothetical protein [Desulfobulbus sp.]
MSVQYVQPPATQSENAMSGSPLPSSDEDAPAQSEAPMGAAQQVQTTLSLPHIIRLVIVNVLVLVELCIAMYMANKTPEEFTPVFFKTFFSLLVPTLILGVISKRFIPKAQQ